MIASSGFQRVNGLRLFVHRFLDEAVQPTGLTIVLLHGFLDAGATWDMVAPALARAGHDVIAPDLRGFGQSDYVGPGGYYHFPDYVADLAELVDTLAPRRLGIVGHSMGGTIAALYAGTYPERVERLALLEGMGPMATEPAVAVDRMQAWLRTLREVTRQPKPLTSLKEAVERLALHHPRVPREVIETRAKLLTRADDTGRLVWAYDPLHRTTSPTPFQTDAFKEFLRRIDCPTLVVSGGPAGWHPPDEADRIACLKYPLHFELPHAGHMMHWTEPHGLAHRLATFFSETPPSKRITDVGTEIPLSLGGLTVPGSPPSMPASSAPSHGASPPHHGGHGPVFAGAAAGMPIPATYAGAGMTGAGTTGPGVGTTTPGAPPSAPPAGAVPAGPTKPGAGITRGGGGSGA
jgi:pimeloyl-ACP methyl ester carboxylesterase